MNRGTQDQSSEIDEWKCEALTKSNGKSFFHKYENKVICKETEQMSEQVVDSKQREVNRSPSTPKRVRETH